MLLGLTQTFGSHGECSLMVDERVMGSLEVWNGSILGVAAGQCVFGWLASYPRGSCRFSRTLVCRAGPRKRIQSAAVKGPGTRI